MIRRCIKYGTRICRVLAMAETPLRLFATQGRKENVVTSKKSLDELYKVVTEKKKEAEEDFPETQGAYDYLESTGFVLEETKDSTLIKLKKKLGSTEIEIRFNAKKNLNIKEANEQEDQIEKNDEEFEPDTYAEFIVAVKGKKGHGILFECVTKKRQLEIISVNFSKDIEALVNLNLLACSFSGNFCPTFCFLDKKIQRSLTKYFLSLGLDEGLFAFIEFKTLQKDFALFIDWLENIRRFSII